MQPKWDGFRLLVEINRDGRTRAWSRHGTDLTARLGLLLAAFTDVAPATTFDGELVAVSERDGKPTQDFAAVTRGVFTAKPAAMDRPSIVQGLLQRIEHEARMRRARGPQPTILRA